jgi:hypothetical protein
MYPVLVSDELSIAGKHGDAKLVAYFMSDDPAYDRAAYHAGGAARPGYGADAGTYQRAAAKADHYGQD